MKFSRAPFLQNYSGKIDEKRISISKKSLVKHSEVLSEREILQKKGINSINESNRIFSEAMKNVSESIVILSKGMRASMLMIKKIIIILEMYVFMLHATNKTKLSTILAKKAFKLYDPFLLSQGYRTIARTEFPFSH